MTLCRFVLKNLSPWPGPLRSDTLYGLICWYVAECEGGSACEKLINAFLANKAPFRLSSALPKDRLPMPALPPIPRSQFRKLAENAGKKEDSGETRLFDALKHFKKFRKTATLPVAQWQAHKGNLSTGALFTSYLAQNAKTHKKNEPQSVTGFEPHVSISRATGQAADGQLFFSRLTFFHPDTEMHLYAETEDRAFLLKYLKIIGTLGFGKDASTGKGQFDVELDDGFAADSFKVENCNAHLCLSVCGAPDMTSVDGFYGVEVKRGKTGPGHVNPFKKPFLFLKEGSILNKKLPGPFVLKDLNLDPAVVQILEPLTLPCHLQESI